LQKTRSFLSLIQIKIKDMPSGKKNDENNRAKQRSPPSSSQKKKYNQKKSAPRPSLAEQRRKRAPIFQHEHVKANIFEEENGDDYLCLLCPGFSFAFKNIRKHLVSKGHVQNADDDPDFLPLYANLLSKGASIDSKLEAKRDKESFLAFIQLCVALNLSTRQISKLAKGLKTLFQGFKLGFLIKANFEESSIASRIDCFGKYYLEKLKAELANTKYSSSIDNAKISNKNVCGVKVRFLKDYPKSQATQVPKIELESKVIGVKYLSQRSDGETLLKVLDEKVFSLDKLIKKNLVGITSDGASAMVGPVCGVISLLKKELSGQYLFSLQDPCHLINLVIKNSLHLLPDEIQDFIDSRHHHFLSPQRTAGSKLKLKQ